MTMNRRPPDDMTTWNRDLTVIASPAVDDNMTTWNRDLTVVASPAVATPQQEVLDFEMHFSFYEGRSLLKKQSSLPKLKDPTKKAGNKSKAKGEEPKRVSKNTASSPKGDFSQEATATTTTAEGAFESPRRKKKDTVPRRKTGDTAPTRSPRKSEISGSASKSGRPSPVPRTKSNPSPSKVVGPSSATTPAVSASTTMAKPPCTPRRHRASLGGDCDVSTSTPTSNTSSTSSASPSKATPKSLSSLSSSSSPSKRASLSTSHLLTSCNSSSSYTMSPARRLGTSLPNTPVRNSCSPAIDRDEDTQTVYTEVDFDTIGEQRVPHHFELLEEPSTTATTTKTTQLQRVIGGGNSGVYAKSGDDDFDDGDAATVSDFDDGIPQSHEQRVAQHYVRLEGPSNTSTTQLQRLIGGGGRSSGVYANRGDDDGAATVFTEVDFGLGKNPKTIGMQKSRLLDITETVKLQNISEQQEGGGSNRNLMGEQCRRRRTSSASFVSTIDSPRKTKVAEPVKQKQPRKNSMSKEYIDDFHVWSDHEEKELGTEDHVHGHVETTNPTMAATHDNHHHHHPLTPLRSQRKQVMSELLVTQSELQQKQRRAPPQHRRSPSLKQRKKVKEEQMPGDGGGGKGTPLQSPTRMDRKTPNRPTTPHRRERLPTSPQKRKTTRQSLKQRPMPNEKVAASTLRAGNPHTHEWDAFPDDNVQYQNGSTSSNLEASFSASFAELALELAASNSELQDPDNLDFNASFSDVVSFSDLATGGSNW